MHRIFGGTIAVMSSILGLGLVACGGGGGTNPTPTPGFTVTATPATLSLTPGGSGQKITLAAAASNGFTGSVAVGVTGLPTGVTASPATVTLVVGTPQTVTLAAATAAAAGASTVTFTGTSGTLSSAATVALTVTSPPDFTLAIAPTSLSLTIGGTGSAVNVTATAVSSFTGTVAVAITGLPAGVTANPATLSLTPGTAQSTTLTAAATAAAATATVTFTGTSGSLSHAATLALTVQAMGAMTNAPDVTTYHFDNARDGLNSAETILTPANVNPTQFGKIGFDTVDGLVDAQPLYVANLTVSGALHNVLYVATENDSIYAFDADSGSQLWKTSVLGNGETTSDDHGCGQITPQIGITSTPVIDRKQGANGTLFTVGMSKDASGNYHQRLHALDLTTGAELAGSPTEISATYPGSGDNSQNGNVRYSGSGPVR